MCGPPCPHCPPVPILYLLPVGNRLEGSTPDQWSNGASQSEGAPQPAVSRAELSCFSLRTLGVSADYQDQHISLHTAVSSSQPRADKTRPLTPSEPREVTQEEGANGRQLTQAGDRMPPYTFQGQMPNWHGDHIWAH